MESSTFYLVVASNGAAAVVNSALIKASASTNPVISTTASYLTQGDSAWRGDGDYSTVVNGVTYAMNLYSYVDATTTLKWKFIVVDARNPASLTSNYVQTAKECLTASSDEITKMWDIITPITKSQVFFHGADDYSPLTNAPMGFNPTSTGNNQQVAWAIDKSWNLNTGKLIVSFDQFILQLFISYRLCSFRTVFTPGMKPVLSLDM